MYSDDGKSHRIKASVLEDSIQGFEEGRQISLRVCYQESGRIIYSYYKGGKLWLPAYPPLLPKPIGVQIMRVSVLSREDFVRSLRPRNLINTAGLKWMPAKVVVTGCSLLANKFGMIFSQRPPIEGIREFEFEGVPSNLLGWNAEGTFLEFRISGMFRQSRTLRIYHNGCADGWLSMQGSMGFERIYLASFDGYRLRLITRAGREFSAATLYINDPSLIYRFETSSNDGPEFIIEGTRRGSELIHVSVRRKLEDSMLHSSATYAHGRLGAEIAYAIATRELGLKRVVLNEPSIGGKDLYTRDGLAVIQARLLTNPGPLQPQRLKLTLRSQVSQLVRKLRQDFVNNPSLEVGYAILSYLDATHDSIVATLWKIRKDSC